VITVDGSEIRRENHLGCRKPCEYWDKLPTSTGGTINSSSNLSKTEVNPNAA